MAGTGIIVCAATRFELDAWTGEGAETLVTGVGIPLALLTVYRRLAEGDPPALLLNIGIAGAYPGHGIAIGDIVVGGSEVYGDVGFELPEYPGFQSLTEMPFGAEYREPFPLEGDDRSILPGTQYRVHGGLRGSTVNVCTGTDATGELRARLTGAAFETMEGAAVAQAGAQFAVPVMEVRAISNIAARRDMRPENIRLALGSLSDYLKRAFPSGKPWRQWVQ